VVVLAHAVAAFALFHRQWSLLAHATSLPVAVGFEALKFPQDPRAYLFGLELPHLLAQFLVQVPLIVIAVAALSRAVGYANRPAFSKKLALGLAAVLLTLCASGLSDRRLKPEDARWAGCHALVFAFGVGCALVPTVTPWYTAYRQGLRRQKKRGLTGPRPLDDHAGNSAWAGAYALLVLGMCAIIALRRAETVSLASLAAMLLYFGWFAAALEYCRLSARRPHSSRFPALMALLWFLMPAVAFIYGAVVAMHTRELALPFWIPCLTVTCPLVGIYAGAGLVAHAMPRVAEQIPITAAVLVVSGSLLVVFAVLARAVQTQISRGVERECRAPTTGAST
jgi:hypothetical protein